MCAYISAPGGGGQERGRGRKERGGGLVLEDSLTWWTS